MKINKLIIDSTYSETELCDLGAFYGTDKSPYNTDVNLHKHSYTAIYDFLFASWKYIPLTLAEIGILKNKSMSCWRQYFPKAYLCGFEFFESEIQNAKLDKLSDTEYHFMDIKSEHSINKSLKDAMRMYDIVIEDSTHVFEDQIRFINCIHKYMYPGAVLVVEDIFKNADENLYIKELSHLSDEFHSVTFIEANHVNNFSPGWDNDKLLVLFKK
jgi:hypothetical protein